MTESASFFTSYVEDRDRLRQLGSILGSTFLRPLLVPEVAEPQQIIVSSFGVMGAGKTILARKATECFKDAGKEVLSLERGSRECRNAKGLTFQYADFGDYTYTEAPGPNGTPGFLDRIFEGKTCKDWLEESFSCDQINGNPGLAVVEHPSFPHLWETDLLVLFGDPLNSLPTVWYYNGYIKAINSRERESRHAGIQKIFIDQVNDVLAKTQTIQNATVDVPRHVDTGEERVIGFCLLTGKEPVREVFSKFCVASRKANLAF